MTGKLGASILNERRVYPSTILRTMYIIGCGMFNPELPLLWSKILSKISNAFKLLLYSSGVGVWTDP
jgi:hypothetical protein